VVATGQAGTEVGRHTDGDGGEDAVGGFLHEHMGVAVHRPKGGSDAGRVEVGTSEGTAEGLQSSRERATRSKEGAHAVSNGQESRRDLLRLASLERGKGGAHSSHRKEGLRWRRRK
jgi:hypothetical protein